MKSHPLLIGLLATAALCLNLHAADLPYTSKADEAPLKEAYFTTSPKDLKDGIAVGTFKAPGTEAAIKSFIADDEADKYQNLDSLLIWKEGKLIFEMYNRQGRVDKPHYMMSITKTLTSVVLGRAIQLGLLSIDDLDKPVIDFMPELDRSKFAKGIDTITLRDALNMKSGLRFKVKNYDRRAGGEKQDYFQKVFEGALPITPESKKFQYSGVNPTMIMMIIDIKTGGKAEDWIKKEVGDKLGLNYTWGKAYGIPKCGAGSSFTSRSLIKVGTVVLQGGKHKGKQFLSPEYVKLIMDTDKGAGYFCYWHNRHHFSKDENEIDFISGVGAGGQYMSIFPAHQLVIVATSTKNKAIKAPLKAIKDHFVKLLALKE